MGKNLISTPRLAPQRLCCLSFFQSASSSFFSLFWLERHFSCSFIFLFCLSSPLFFWSACSSLYRGCQSKILKGSSPLNQEFWQNSPLFFHQILDKIVTLFPTLFPTGQNLFHLTILIWFALSRLPKCHNKHAYLNTQVAYFFSHKVNMSLFNGEDLFYDGKQMCKESILSYGQDSLSLVAFMVSWLSIYTLPHGLSDIIRPSTIYPAMCLVIGYKLPLCSALVTRLCSGLRSQIVGGQETYPSMIFYAWYCLHCNAPSQCCNFPRPPFHRHLKTILSISQPRGFIVS